MTDSSVKEKSASEDPLANWLETAGDFWETMFQSWTQILKNTDMSKPSKEPSSGSVKSTLNTVLKTADQFSEFASSPESMASLFKSAGAMPQLLARAVQTGINGFMQYQQKWFERAGKLGQSSEAFKYENLDENAFHAWTEVYESEFKRFFHIPQLGLTRFHQEKMAAFIDKFNIYQATLAEFQRLLFLPVNRSMSLMQEKLGEMARENPLPEDPNAYYQLWVKILEGHYMTLFQSPEYINILGKTMEAMNDYTQAKNEIIEDMLSMTPVATHKDVDELYREIYLLKKRIKALEKQVLQ